MADVGRVPEGVDLSRPNAARVYDYYLGGSSNFAIDRQFAEQALRQFPQAAIGARRNRLFLRRAVRYCVDQGVRQFLDLGSGIPTVGNVHEVAQRADPECRVLYVDNEGVAVAHSRAMLRDNPRADILPGDLTDPEYVLSRPQTLALIDFAEPVAVLLAAALHFVPDEADPIGILRRYREAMAPGSLLAISHAARDRASDEALAMTRSYRSTANPVFLRGKSEIEALFDGFELVQPGVVFTTEWRPESVEDVAADAAGNELYAGLARRP